MDVEQSTLPVPEPKDKYEAAADFVVSAVFLSFSLFVLVESIKMPIRGGKLILSPGLIPTAIGILMVFLSTFLMISTIKHKGPGLIMEWVRVTLGNEEFQRWFYITLITGVYILSVGRIHFFAVTFVYLSGLFFYLKATDKKINLNSIITLLATALFATLLVSGPCSPTATTPWRC